MYKVLYVDRLKHVWSEKFFEKRDDALEFFLERDRAERFDKPKLFTASWNKVEI